MENQQKKIFANCSQTVRNHCEFRNELATSFALRNPIAPVHCTLAKFFSHKTYAKFRIAKIRNEFANQFRNAKISQCQIRNAKISQCQIRNANFAMPISQCQIQFRNANFKFAMPIHCSFVSQSKPLRNFALRNSQPTLRISQTHFALPNSLPLRNSHLQALSSFVINATDFQTW